METIYIIDDVIPVRDAQLYEHCDLWVICVADLLGWHHYRMNQRHSQCSFLVISMDNVCILDFVLEQDYILKKLSFSAMKYCSFYAQTFILTMNVENEKAHSAEIKLPIFLDYQSTTKVDPRVLEVMIPYFGEFSNAHSRSHSFGWAAEEAVEKARKHIAGLVNADNKEIIFTSGATESNNMAIKGVAHFYRNKGDHIITVCTEHKCVLDSCRHLENEGFKVTYLPVKQNGIIDLSKLEEAITDRTILVSVMMANNEIGVVQPVKEIGAICRKHNIFFHTDAAQSFGKVPIDVNEMSIDLMSLSSHKIYGPMGIGALYVRRKNPRVRLTPLISGGGQERGMRSGTVPTPLAVGFGEAARIAKEEMETEATKLEELRDILYSKIKEAFPDVVLNGDYENRIPGNLNLSFPYVEGESLIMAIKDLAVSSGSACTSASLEPSYVIRSLNNGHDLEHSSIRFGFGRFTTKDEVLYAADLIAKNVGRLREMSPLWEMVQEGVDLNTVKWDSH